MAAAAMKGVALQSSRSVPRPLARCLVHCSARHSRSGTPFMRLAEPTHTRLFRPMRGRLTSAWSCRRADNLSLVIRPNEDTRKGSDEDLYAAELRRELRSGIPLL